jgi:hypothetical protein
MSKKAFVPPHFAPLQRIVAVPVTDPAEIAAMEKVRMRLKQKQKRRNTTTNRNGVRKTAGKGKS